MKPQALTVRVSLGLESFALDLDFTTTAHVTGIFGPSGSGKTSLLEAVAGLRRRARGLIRLGDETWLDSTAGIALGPEARHTGYVPQDALLFPHLDVRRNLLAGAARASRHRNSPDGDLRAVCDLLELDPLLTRDVTTLSGGEARRVALGRALLSGPRLLLLDEPLASLDLPLRRRVLPFLRRVRNEFAVPMLLVSHDPTEVQALCDEVIVLRRGTILARGAPRDVLTDPEVFGLAEADGFENVVPCVLLATGAETSEVRLGDDTAPTLVTPRATGRPGDALLVGIPAREILVASERPVGLSAQNILPAHIVAVRTLPDRRLVTATLGAGIPHVAAELTARACEDLGLAPGRPVYLVIKAAGLVLYEDGRP